MIRMLAIVEREIRKYFRSPSLMVMSMMMPLLQLLIMGNAFGGKIVGARLALVDYDRGPQAIKIREAFDSIAVNVKTFTAVEYNDENQAREGIRTGKIDAAVIIPPHYSRRVYAQNTPSLGLVVDNTDQFTSASIENEMQSLITAITAPVIQSNLTKSVAVGIVEIYPYINYMKFLLPAIIALSMYVSVMIGGGIVYIDDKAQGVHEGYLVTPITRLELVLGINLAGTIKATLAGISLTVIGTLMAGLGVIFYPVAALELLALILATAIAFNGMMFLLMVRVADPLVPRALSGFLNILLFYPSGAIYPITAFPRWLRAIAVIDPFTYCIHGFRAVLLKNGGFAAIQYDLLFLSLFGVGSLLIATPLFRRTL